MLTLEIENYLWEYAGGVVYDANAEFTTVMVPDDDYCKRAVKAIDYGTLKADGSFVDRHGNVLPWRNLSTGCKVALMVYMKPNSKIHSAECGFNARDFIICNCDRGTLILTSPGR